LENKNGVLALLPPREFKLLAAELEPMDLGFLDMLYEPHEPIRHIYFLQQGIASVVTPMENGSEIEVGMIGREGFVGKAVLLATDRTPNRTFVQLPGAGHRIKSEVLLELVNANQTIRDTLLFLVQLPGEAWKMKAEVLRQEFRKDPALQKNILRYMHATFAQISQTALCNRLHTVEERLARWLLLCYDRMNGQQITLTHEMLGKMLGTRRSTVSLAAATLQQAGMVTYNRGRISLKDRKGLMRVSCSCYAMVKKQFEGLYG